MKLSKRQANATEKSIQKWEAIVLNDEVDERSSNCELCKKYNKNDCNFCPVAMTVKSKHCNNTPWVDWADYCINKNPNLPGFWMPDISVFDAESKRLAQAELDFLRGILEEST